MHAFQYVPEVVGQAARLGAVIECFIEIAKEHALSLVYLPLTTRVLNNGLGCWR